MPKTLTKTAAKTKDGLNQKQELFCQLYASADRELFGNGTRCYMQAYSSEGKKMSVLAAMAAASRLLRDVKVIQRINELLEEGGLNDQNVDKQLLFVINQFADFKSKVAAIKEYNAMRNRVASKSEGGDTFNTINIFSDERAARIARRVLNGDSQGEAVSS